VFVPAVRTSTEESRSALPPQITHRDAAYSAGRAALLVAALTERPDLLLDATEDRLHQVYRLPAVPTSAQLVQRLRENGIPAVLSGSGPTVLAVCRDEAEAADAAAVSTTLTQDSVAGAVHVLRPGIDRGGCVVLRD
jgi:homoserine kinase